MAFFLAAPAHAQAPAPTPTIPAAPLGQDLDLKQIRGAIQKGVKALYAIEPIYTFPPDYAYVSKYYDQETRNMTGNHALACWAMLACGESYQNPPLYRRINWVLSGDSSYTYDRGMRATMLNELPHARWYPWVHRDALWHTRALTDEGNFGENWNGEAAAGPGDNANGQYGVLGLWNLQLAGYGVEGGLWKKVDAYWREAQQKTDGDAAAGWGVYSFAKPPPGGGANKFYSRVSGPMTAGGVATLSLTERYLYSGGKLEGGRFISSPQLRKGIRWLDENFSLSDKDEATDQYYYLWTIQRVGGATGYRTFHNIDWFREVTGWILRQQKDSGEWRGDKGTLLSTGFALLYLAKANDPLAISKLRFSTPDGDEAWNNRPHDVWNFVDYASDEYEVSTTWQITDLSQPVYGLIESPILYLSTDRAFSFSDKELDNLRGYLEAGGLLVSNQESQSGEGVKSLRAMLAKLFPGQELQQVPRDDKFFDVHQKLPPGVQMQVIRNGLRPLVVHFTKDIGRGLQSGDLRAEGFAALSNVYLYVTGRDPRRGRLENHFNVQRVEKPAGPLPAARIRHGGTFDPEPNATRQLKAILANDFNIDLQLAPAAPGELSAQKIGFLTATGDAKLTDAEAASIRKWLEGGGTLWLDAAGGGEAAHRNALELLGKIAPSAAATPIPTDDAIITGQLAGGGPGGATGYDNRRVQYRLFALRTMGPVYQPRLQAVRLGERPAIIYSSEDLTCGLAGLDHWGIFGYTPEFARRLAVNGCLAAMANPTPDPGKPGATFAQSATTRPTAPATQP